MPLKASLSYMIANGSTYDVATNNARSSLYHRNPDYNNGNSVTSSTTFKVVVSLFCAGVGFFFLSTLYVFFVQPDAERLYYRLRNWFRVKRAARRSTRAAADPENGFVPLDATHVARQTDGQIKQTVEVNASAESMPARLCKAPPAAVTKSSAQPSGSGAC